MAPEHESDIQHRARSSSSISDFSIPAVIVRIYLTLSIFRQVSRSSHHYRTCRLILINRLTQAMDE